MQPMDQPTGNASALPEGIRAAGRDFCQPVLEMLENGRMEAHAAIEALEGMMASEDGIVLLQIGGGASVRAKIL